LLTTGIDIQGNNRSIKLQADKVTFTNSAGNISGKIWIDAEKGTLHAEDGEFAGTLRAKKIYNMIVRLAVEAAWERVADGQYEVSTSSFLSAIGGTMPVVLCLYSDMRYSVNSWCDVWLPMATAYEGCMVEISSMRSCVYEDDSNKASPKIRLNAFRDRGDDGSDDYGFCDARGSIGTMITDSSLRDGIYSGQMHKFWTVKLLAYKEPGTDFCSWMIVSGSGYEVND
jgi:hypothetical protein